MQRSNTTTNTHILIMSESNTYIIILWVFHMFICFCPAAIHILLTHIRICPSPKDEGKYGGQGRILMARANTEEHMKTNI